MFEFLQSLIGEYTVHFISAAIDIVICWFYMLILCSEKKRKNWFPVRIGFLFAADLLLCVGLSALRTNADTLPIRILFELGLAALELINIFFLYHESLSESLMMFSSVIVAKNFSGTVIPLLRNLLGNNDMETISFFSDYVPMRDWSIYLGIQLLFLFSIAYLFRRADGLSSTALALPGSLFIFFITLIMKCVMAPVARFYQPTSFSLSMFVKVLIAIMYLVIIAIRAGLVTRQKIETELQITESLLRQEKKRYTEMRDSIEVINMRCHDLKRQLSKLQNKLTQEEVDALREAIEIYDSNINTGNEIVDTVLYQKELYCRKNGIRLSWVCDGKCLSFISPSSLYALLENAMENAIEATINLPEEQKIITINAFQEGGSVQIEVSNYFDSEKEAQHGTTKEDKVHHGLGLKSMRYIASSYGGTIETSCVDNIFILNIHIPCP